jgi:hypothetical protein
MSPSGGAIILIRIIMHYTVFKCLIKQSSRIFPSDYKMPTPLPPYKMKAVKHRKCGHTRDIRYAAFLSEEDEMA